ncbi:MAG: hypothetical protein NC086_07075 [Alistipes sp.]|nr:hypothetical protein [Alistipes sp.]
MKKRILYLCLCLCMIFFSACQGKTTEEETKSDIEQITEAYKRLPKNEGEIRYTTEEKAITFDEGHFFLLANDEGIYFASSPNTANGNRLRVWYKKYGQEEQTCVFEAGGNTYVAGVMTGRGEAVLELGAGYDTDYRILGETIDDAKRLFNKNISGLVGITVYQDWIFVSYTLQEEGKSVLYKINLNDMSEEMIYETSIQYDSKTGRYDGEKIVYCGGTEECLYFQILGLKDQTNEECEDRRLYKYQNGEISLVMVPEDILVNISGVNGKLLIVEYASDEPWRDTCSIIDTDTNEVLGVLEGIEPAMEIRKSVVYEDYILFTNYYNMYIYDTVQNKLEMITVEDEHSQIEIYGNKFSYYDHDKGCVCIVSVESSS